MLSDHRLLPCENHAPARTEPRLTISPFLIVLVLVLELRFKNAPTPLHRHADTFLSLPCIKGYSGRHAVLEHFTGH